MKISLKTLFSTTLILGALALPAMAQDTDLQALMNRMERMDRDIKALNLKVYREGQATTAVSNTSAGEDVSGPLGARLSIRINELENQLRNMTGQIEETAYRISQLTTRMDKLVADMDYRLTVLEGGTPNTGIPSANNLQEGQPLENLPSGVSGQQLAPPVGSAQLQGQTETRQEPQAPQQGTQPGVLGTLAQKDLNAPLSTQPAQLPQTTPSAPKADLTPQAQYESSRQMLMRGEFVEAEKTFKAFLAENKDHELSGNARYWLGETYYVQGNYAQAASTFLEGYQKATRGAKAPDSLLKLGMSLTRLEKQREACATFGKLRADFPKMPAHLSKTLERERATAKCN